MAKPADHGIGYVVDHKTSDARYAVSPENVNPKVHDIVRPLKLSETVRGFTPKRLNKKPSGPATSAGAPDTDATPATNETK